MTSSTSESRSRSNRRSPAKKAADEGEAKGTGAAGPASADASPSRRPASPKGAPPVPAGQPEDSKEKTSRAGRSKASGARKSWRNDGDKGTWTCPDCHRVILDHPAGKDQHKVSAYHLSYLLWNAGCFSTVQMCDEYAKEWSQAPDRFQIRGKRFCQIKPPPAYWDRVAEERSRRALEGARAAEHGERRRHRSCESRSKDRGRRRDRRSRSVSAEKSRLRSREAVKAARSRSKDRRERGRRRRSSSSKETVELEDEPSRKSKSVVAATASAKPGSATEKARPPASKEAGKVKEAAQSSDYEYDDDSSPADCEKKIAADKKKPLVAVKSAAKAKAGSGAVAAAQAAGPDRQVLLMNSLLKTAMETAASLPQ